jgi:hypothetical protein
MTDSEWPGGYQLAVLKAIMSHFPPSSHAARDFASECARVLGVALSMAGTGARVPDDMWEYWSAVAAGRSKDYDEAGAPKTER